MKDFITVTSGISGWFAVQMTWNSEFEIWEPWTTGFGRYPVRHLAIEEARNWAEAEELEFKRDMA